jgi:hypothetical protein
MPATGPRQRGHSDPDAEGGGLQGAVDHCLQVGLQVGRLG